MRIQELRLSTPRIPFKVAFRHASAERAETSSLWIEAVSDGGIVGYGESCPRPYVTGETIETAQAFFAEHEASIRASVIDLPSLRAWSGAHAAAIDANPAAWCAIELAAIDAIAKEATVPVEALLGLPALSGRFQYTAVVGDSDDSTFEAMARRYAAQGFRDFKIKLSGDAARDAAKADALAKLDPAPARIRVDANNLWGSADEAIAFLRGLNLPLFAVEEPVRANDYDAMAAIADALGAKIILDESLLHAEQIVHLRVARPLSARGEFRDASERWLINVRVSKMGGLLRSLAVVEAARSAGIGVIVGAQVGETSLLTRAGLVVAQAAGDALAAQEGAFGTLLLERDVCDPPLMFGRAGVLDVAKYPWLSSGAGFGFQTLAHV